jgi:hypothetical protein
MNLEGGVLKPMVLTLSPEAKVSWTEYHNLAEQGLGIDGDYQTIKSIAAKSAENLLRIAGNFQVTIDPNSKQIDGKTMDCAALVANYYLNESLKMAVPQAELDAEKTLQWLIRTIGMNPLEKRLVSKNSGIRIAARVNPAINYLIEQGMVQSTSINNVEWLAVNRKLLEGR